LLVSLLLVASIGYVGFRALRTSINWLHRQPEYQLDFTAIQLEEPLPDWYRGRTEDFLKHVQESSREHEFLPLLELEAGRIKMDFLQSPWVEEVRRVEYPPQGVKVSLVFKRPVAFIPLSRGEQVVLDRNGHILPADDVVTGQQVPLVKIVGDGLTGASDNRPGKVWKANNNGPVGSRIERGVLGAAKLAGFLLEPTRLELTAGPQSLRILRIYAVDSFDRGLFLQNAENANILWGDPPGKEPSGSPSAEEKWEALKIWAKSNSRKILKPGDYWEFFRVNTRAELRPVEIP
jgi:hypothetical protein